MLNGCGQWSSSSFDINVHELAAFPFPFTLWVGFLCVALRPNNRWAGLVLDCIYQAITDLGVETIFRSSQWELSTVLDHDFLTLIWDRDQITQRLAHEVT